MLSDAPVADLNTIRANLLDADRGFHVFRGFYSPEEVAAYRTACSRFLEHGRVIHQRINSDSTPDYIHPRSHDRHNRTYRIYQFFHNHHGDMMGRLFSRAMSLRNQIEQEWDTDPRYKSERDRLQSYCVVTYYLDKVGMLPRHQDYCGPAPFPLIQFWVALSEPGVDYREGNLALFSRTGIRRRAETDLNLKIGDALIFDKSLFHEVEATEPGAGSSLGRWTALIGARAPRVPSWKGQIRGICYDSRVHPTLRNVANVVRRFRVGASIDRTLRDRLLREDAHH